MKKKTFPRKFQCRQKTTADLDLARVLLTCGRDNKRRPIKGLLHSRSDRSTGGQMDPKYLGRSAIKTFNSVPCHPILDGTSDWPLVTFEKKLLQVLDIGFQLFVMVCCCCSWKEGTL